MKSLIKDIVVFITAVIGEFYVFLLVPYMEFTHENGDGFVILVPVFVTPVIGLLLGLLAERKFIFSLPVIVAILSVILMVTLCNQFMLGYLLIFTLGTLLGMVIGIGIRYLIISLANGNS